MKKLISLLILLSINTQASCFNSAAEFLMKNGNRSDQRLNLSDEEVLVAKTPLLTERGDFLNTYPMDTILYYNSGSYHSGYFREVVVLNPRTCKVLNAYTVAAE